MVGVLLTSLVSDDLLLPRCLAQLVGDLAADLRKALEFDARLMSLMCHNVHSVWPHKAQMGGFPGAGALLWV